MKGVDTMKMNSTDTQRLLDKLGDKDLTWYDEATELYFVAKPSEVNSAELELNKILFEQGRVYTFDWACLLGLELDWKPEIAESGWDMNCLNQGGETWIQFTHYYEEKNGREYFKIVPCRMPCDGVDSCGC